MGRVAGGGLDLVPPSKRRISDPPAFPHMGEPAGLSQRAASKWRRAHTHYINASERIRPEVVGDPPDCFTPKEWEQWLDTLPIGSWHMEGSPNKVLHETEAEALARQRRSTLAAACEDCTLAYQLGQVIQDRCHPPEHAITPADRLRTDQMEGSPNVVAPGDGTQPPNVLFQAQLRDGENR